MSDPFAEIIAEQARLDAQIRNTKLKETPLQVRGSFVPLWVGSTIAGSFTYTTAACLVEWTRHNDRLFFNGRIVISAIGVAPTGNLTITGWPYSGVTDGGMVIAGGGTLITWTLNLAAGYTDASLQFTNSAVATVLRSGDNVAAVAVAGGELIVGDCRFFGHYRITA